MSILLSVKFLEDVAPNLSLVSDSLGVSKQRLIDIEKEFLQAMEYNLYISSAEIELIRSQAEEAP